MSTPTQTRTCPDCGNPFHGLTPCWGPKPMTLRSQSALTANALINMGDSIHRINNLTRDPELKRIAVALYEHAADLERAVEEERSGARK